MASTNTAAYEKAKTALILIDPINDFLATDGKMYSALVESVKKQNLIEKLAKLHEAAHRAGLITFYPLHHQFQEGDFENWKHMTPMQVAAKQSKFCQAGSKGAEVHEQLRPKAGDVLVGQHWSSSSFANTDLDYHLKRHGIEYVIIVGLEALTCVESTGRWAVELGYHVTMVTDGTAAFSDERFDVATKVNYPAFAHSVVKVEQVVEALKNV